MKNIASHILDAIADEIEVPLSQAMKPLRNDLITQSAIRSARRTGEPIDDPPYYFVKNKMRLLEHMHSMTQFGMGFEMIGHIGYI